MCENVDFLCFWVFVKIWILFQSQDGSDDHDSPGLWRPPPGSFSSRRRADRKVSYTSSGFSSKNYYFSVFRNILEYQNQAKRLFKTLNENSPKICSVETGNFLFQWVVVDDKYFGWLFLLLLSYIIEQQTCFLTLTEKQFSKKTAYSFLEDLAGEFHSQYGHKINTATRPYSFIEFDTYIQVSFLFSKYWIFSFNLTLFPLNVIHDPWVETC